MTKPIKPGSKVPDSGIYKEVGTPRRATLVKGEPRPTNNQEKHGMEAGGRYQPN